MDLLARSMSWGNLIVTVSLTHGAPWLWRLFLDYRRRKRVERERAELVLEAMRCIETIVEFDRCIARHRDLGWSLQRLDNLLRDYEHVKSQLAAQGDDPEWVLDIPALDDFNDERVETIMAAVLREYNLQKMKTSQHRVTNSASRATCP
jgi:hypothetical protein